MFKKYVIFKWTAPSLHTNSVFIGSKKYVIINNSISYFVWIDDHRERNAAHPRNPPRVSRMIVVALGFVVGVTVFSSRNLQMALQRNRTLTGAVKLTDFPHWELNWKRKLTCFMKCPQIRLGQIGLAKKMNMGLKWLSDVPVKASCGYSVCKDIAVDLNLLL